MPKHPQHRRSTPAARRRFAVAGIALAAVGVGTAAWAAPARAVEPVVVDSLAVTPSAPSAGAQATATAKLHSLQKVKVQALAVAVRSASGANYDFPGAIQTTLTSKQQTFTPQSRTFPAGTYKYFVSYEVNNVWHPLSPVGSFTAGATAPAPTPTPTPVPTATPTVTPTATPTPAATGGPVGVGGSWNLKFADEFNGGALDSSKWTPGWYGDGGSVPSNWNGVSGPVNPYESQCYNASHATVSGGSLHLTATQDASTCTSKGTTASHPYTSGLISSNPHDGRASGGYEFTYGYTESRIYLPPSGSQIANWPAFWTDGQSWPTNGELDVMEGLSGQACYHFHSPSGGPGGCASGNFSGWHTYGADWEPGSVTYYYDGVKVGQITSGITSAPQFLILNNAVDTAGNPTVAPADMQVDYVRVWQH